MIYLLYIPYAGLWYLGGGEPPKWARAWMRDILIPILAGGTLALKYHHTWQEFLMCFLTVGTFQIIRLGYGAYDPEHDDKPSFLAKITHDRLGAINRAIYGALVGFVGLLPYEIITHHHLHYVLYALGCSLTGFIVVKLKTNRYITDLNLGAAVGNVIIL